MTQCKFYLNKNKNKLDSIIFRHGSLFMTHSNQPLAVRVANQYETFFFHCDHVLYF